MKKSQETPLKIAKQPKKFENYINCPKIPKPRGFPTKKKRGFGAKKYLETPGFRGRGYPGVKPYLRTTK